MSDKFDFRNWITQNNVGPYSKMSSNKRLINENIEEENTEPEKMSVTFEPIDVTNVRLILQQHYLDDVSVEPNENIPKEYIMTGPKDDVMKALSILGYEEGDYELSEDIQEMPTEDNMEEAQSEMDNYDRAWGLVGNQLKDAIDTLRQDGYEDEDIMDIMRTAIEQYDQVFPG